MKKIIVNAEKKGGNFWSVTLRFANGTETTTFWDESEYRLQQLKEKLHGQCGVPEVLLEDFEESVRAVVRDERYHEECD